MTLKIQMPLIHTAKAKTTITNADFAKAKKYVKSGGKVDAIKSKYTLNYSARD